MTKTIVEALATRLLRDNGPNSDCELTGFSGSGRCIEPAVAVRFDREFVDLVCVEHAERSRKYGKSLGIRIAFAHEKEETNDD